MSRPVLLCTVGTSLLNPANFAGRRNSGEIVDWSAVAEDMLQAAPSTPACGAEFASIASLVRGGYCPHDAAICLLHSDTEDGRHIARVLADVLRWRGHQPVESIAIPDLQDVDPRRFRTKGLRNLAKLICARVRSYSPEACAINATGGYKAQIAVAVLLGQALGIPVYYMHERFSEIISFPPLPIAWDLEVWMRASGLLVALEKEPQPKKLFEEEWDERYESLVDTESLDGVPYIELSPAGQIFHELFRVRFRSAQDEVLPPPALRKLEPVLHDHHVINLLRPDLIRYLGALTKSVPAVVRCITNYCNPNLPEPTRFRLRGEDIEGIYTDGTRTVKFKVESTANTPGQRSALVAALNQWRRDR